MAPVELVRILDRSHVGLRYAYQGVGQSRGLRSPSPKRMNALGKHDHKRLHHHILKGTSIDRLVIVTIITQT